MVAYSEKLYILVPFSGGLLTELGPYFITPHLELQENIYAWNKLANVIFLESPQCVGYSIDSTRECTMNDNSVGIWNLEFKSSDSYLEFQTGYLNYKALVDFYRQFPKLRKNDFYISGESYAGIYAPITALNILGDSENFPNFKVKSWNLWRKSKLQFQGLAIGNGYVSSPLLYNTVPGFLYYHSVIGEEWVKILLERIWSPIKFILVKWRRWIKCAATA